MTDRANLIFLLILLSSFGCIAVERTAPEMASVAHWLKKFIKDPDDVKIEPFYNSNGDETYDMLDIDSRLKESFVTSWMQAEGNRTSELAIFDAFTKLEAVLPFFDVIIDANNMLDNLLALGDELQPALLKKLTSDGPIKSDHPDRIQKLKFLLNFYSESWPSFEKIVKQMLTANNDFGFGQFSSTELSKIYKTLKTFFFRIVNNIMILPKRDAYKTSREALELKSSATEYRKNLFTVNDVNILIHLENARKNFIKDIPALNEQIRVVVQQYSNAKTPAQIADILKIVDELITKRDKLFVKWTTLLDKLRKYSQSVYDSLEERLTIAKEIHRLYGVKD